MDRRQFWDEARRRRNHVLLWIPAWLVVGLPLYGLFKLFTSAENSELPGLLAIAVWFSVFMYLRERIVRMRCFRCGERAFEQWWFPLQVSRCKHCGANSET